MSSHFPLEDSRILVIGGGGFIGSHLVDLLIKEPVRNIVVYDNFTRGTRSNLTTALQDDRVRIFADGGDILHVDILDKAISEADYVFHLAALWLLQCYEYPRSAYSVNVEGTFNVIDSCVRHNIRKLIFSSSASVYGNARSVPMSEDHPFDNETFYGASKIAGEQFLKSYHCRYGLPFAGLRYMNVYGERQDYKGAYIAVIMKMLDRVDQGLPPVVHGDGSFEYDFVHVEDVARANIAALKSPITSGFYNVGTGKGTSLRKLAEVILDLANSDLDVKYEPSTQSFVTHRIGSTEKAEIELGFKSKIELREGLLRLIDWRKIDQDKF